MRKKSKRRQFTEAERFEAIARVHRILDEISRELRQRAKIGAWKEVT